MASTGRLRHKMCELWSIDTRSLALFRMALGILLLGDLTGRLIDLEGLYGANSVQPVAVVREFLQEQYPGAWSVHLLSGSTTYQACLLLGAAGLAIALILGWRTRLVAVGCWVLLASLHARSPLVTNGGDVLLRMMLLWSLFLPLGERWSLDAQESSRPPRRRICSVASVAALLQLCLMYQLTGLFKWNPLWLEGDALAEVLSLRLYSTDWGRLLLDYPAVLRWGTWLTLALELLGPWLLFCPWKQHWFRGLTVIGLAGMHLGIEWTMHVDLFSYACWVALILFVPAEFWETLTRWVLERWVLEHWEPYPLPYRDETTVPEVASYRQRSATLLCGLLLIVVVLFNLGDLALRWELAREPIPAAMHRLVQVAALDQRWDMFRRAGGPDCRLLAFAELQDGREIDLLRNRPPSEDLHELEPAFAPRRWALCVTELRRPSKAAFRLPTAEFLAARWDREHPSGERVRHLVLLLLREPIGNERVDKAVIYVELERP
ncbi:MAG TPA: hypothetical protein DCE55_04770 [Planctomycetaceae bacterium]|nr:hypothetical protein [Planctomycetaceae bacterium]